MLSALRRPHEAIGAYQRALEQRDDLPEAWINLGAALRATGKASEAAAAIEKSLQFRPDSFGAWFNLGNARAELKQPQAAAEAFAHAAHLRPKFAEAWLNLGVANMQLRDLPQAINAFDRAKEAQPKLANAWINAGLAQRAAGDERKAVENLRRGLELDPNHAEAMDQLGAALRRIGEFDASITSYRRLIALRPDRGKALLRLSALLQDVGNVSESLQVCDQYISLHTDDPDAASYRFCLLHLHPDYTPEKIYHEHLEWDRRFGGTAAGPSLEHQNPRDPDRRLRIGYVSPDFRLHSVSFFMEDLLAHHDPEHFEIYCYSDVARGDEVTERIRKLSRHWWDVAGRETADVAELIRRDGIDILVDCSGHMGGNRLLVFARKPAPVQVTYLGYPGTTGLRAMDYRMTDGWADPVGKTEMFHSERLIRLPRTLACFRPWENSPPPMPTPGLRRGYATFGCFTVLRKVGDRLLRAWAEILSRMPGSRLILGAEGLGDPAVRGPIAESFRRVGVEEDRIIYRGSVPMSEYFAAHHEVDIMLDTFPVNGHTVVCHALWMGVPVVSLAGAVHCQRLGASVLNNLGLGELVADSHEEYVRLAVSLGSDLTETAKLAAGLRERMRSSPLVDAKQLARDIESAYREMWQSWCAIAR